MLNAHSKWGKNEFTTDMLAPAIARNIPKPIKPMFHHRSTFNDVVVCSTPCLIRRFVDFIYKYGGIM